MSYEQDPVGFDAGPPDPFLGDPADPAALFDDVDPVVPLTIEERADVEDDLAELLEFEAALAPIGFRGVVVDCADCGEPHYFSWSLMTANLRSLLGLGVTQPHEPAFAPDANTFVSWDYARGYTDALTRN
jgi:hypothetical protein